MSLFKKLVVSLLLISSTTYAAVVNASGVLGQGGSYTTNTVNYPSGSINASGLHSVASLTSDTTNHRLFAVDTSNNRVLVFDLDSNNALSSMSASHVLGSCSFTSAGSG